MYGVIMSFREREEWGAVVTSCFAEYGMMTMVVVDVALLMKMFLAVGLSASSLPLWSRWLPSTIRWACMGLNRWVLLFIRRKNN